MANAMQMCWGAAGNHGKLVGVPNGPHRSPLTSFWPNYAEQKLGDGCTFYTTVRNWQMGGAVLFLNNKKMFYNVFSLDYALLVRQD